MNQSPKAIIFGYNGQDGQYLGKLLDKKNLPFIGISRKGEGTIGDVANYDFVESVILEYKPAYIFHLAARSSTHHSALFENHETICTGTLNILEAVKLHSPVTKVFLSGSAMQFRNNDTPINEDTPFDASSAYSVARIQSVYAGRYFRSKFELKVYVGYFFNHDSPFRTEHHVNQKIAQAVIRISKGSNEKLEIGNVNVKKEFNYAGDVVEAVWLLVNQDSVFEAVIGSGKAYSILDWVQCCFKKIGANWKDHVITNNSFIPEYDMLVSDPGKIKSMGWKAKTSFEELAEMMLSHEINA
jgi:GDPmannose 4,6-dehydratase